jgi:hypothetical protein
MRESFEFGVIDTAWILIFILALHLGIGPLSDWCAATS